MRNRGLLEPVERRAVGSLRTYRSNHTRSTKEIVMNFEQQAMNDAMQNKNMMDDPNWTDADRQKYQNAYMAAKNKQDNR